MPPSGDKQLFVSLRSPATDEPLAPPELLRRLVADVEEQGSNLTDVATKIICDRLGLPFVPNGRKTSPGPDAAAINMRVSPVIWRALASFGEGSRQDAARTILCEHYRLAPLRTIAKQTRRAAA